MRGRSCLATAGTRVAFYPASVPGTGDRGFVPFGTRERRYKYTLAPARARSLLTLGDYSRLGRQLRAFGQIHSRPALRGNATKARRA